MEKRYYYKDQNGNTYNLKSKLVAGDPNIVPITEQEYIQSITVQMDLTREQILAYAEKNELNNELQELLQWFNLYDIQVAQYNRSQRLGVPFTSHLGTIQEMDALAERKANRINEIRELLKENQ